MNTIDIVKDIVEALAFTEVIDNITDNLDGTYTIALCKTHHQTPGKIVNLAGSNYLILEVVVNTSIKIKDLDAAGQPLIITWSIAAPKFFHGTAVDVNNEVVVNEADLQNILPMVYFFEKYSEKYFGAVDSAIDRESSVRLFFLDQVNFEDWNTEDHYNNVIKAMNNLTIDFLEAAKQSKYIGVFSDYQKDYWRDFGVIKTNEGIKNQIFDMFTSGVELKISLPIMKMIECC